MTLPKRSRTAKIGYGSSTNPWLRFELSQMEYKHWQHRYQNDGFVKHKLRYDYFPSAGLIIQRMPTVLHDQLASSFIRNILWWGGYHPLV